MRRTGLVCEAAAFASGAGTTKVVRRRFGKAHVTDVRVGLLDAHRLGKSVGRYITIEGDPQEHAVSLLLQKALEQFLPREGLILAAGLGNPDIARDSLGSRTISLLRCGEGRRSLMAMETDVSARTGIETARMVRGVATEMNAACVLAVDALACCDPLKIGCTVQLSNAGVQPGSGVLADSPVLSRSFVGVPVIAVGVPTVSEISGITGNVAHRGFLAAPANEDALAQLWAETIAQAVNMAVGL